MAFLKTGFHFTSDWFGCKNPITLSRFLVSHKRRKKKFNCSTQHGLNSNNHSTWSLKNLPKFLKLPESGGKSTGSGAAEDKTPSLSFNSEMINQFTITQEIQFFRDCRNHFVQMIYNDMSQPIGPPLAILLHPRNLDENLLKKMIEIYGEKGFDVLTVNLTTNQMLYPCVAGNAMNVVTDLLECLNDTHRCRPYVFHGFSVGCYIYGEILAQFADQYETYRTIMDNVKGCLWDSPVDVMAVKQCIGKFLHPNNLYFRWRCNRAVKKHFRKRHHDSIVYWNRSRDNFCNPIIKVPNVFLTSCTDILSNPYALQTLLKTLESNEVPIFHKTWWDSEHTQHFEKYYYEYLFGMILFFNLCHLYPDHCGKYRSSPNLNLSSNFRPHRKAWDT